MKALWIPIFSMRSHETGEYSILKDGNFQLTLARVLASDFDHVFLAVPDNASDVIEVSSRLRQYSEITLLPMKYGVNAVQTREQFWEMNDSLLPTYEIFADVVITDITGYDGRLPFVNNFNITKLPELDRPYIDKFFETDLESIERALFTTVLNPRQRQYILEQRPDLLDKIFVNTKCVHRALLPQPDLDTMPTDSHTIFWPFRISDTAYRFEEFLRSFENQELHHEGYKIVVTDPNDSLKIEKPYLSKIKPSKAEYYETLRRRPVIVMLDDIDTVLHPGTIEFFVFGCPVITYIAGLITNPNAITNLTWLEHQLSNLVYNPVDVSAFAYDQHEIDSLYNKAFIDVRTN